MVETIRVILYKKQKRPRLIKKTKSSYQNIKDWVFNGFFERMLPRKSMIEWISEKEFYVAVSKERFRIL